MANNPVSCHLITWGNDLETGMREASELGFGACETFTHLALAYEDRVDAFREMLDERGLRLSALYGGGRFSDPAQEEDVIAYNTRVAHFLAAMGVDRMVFGPRGPRTGPTDRDGLRQMVRTIDEAARRTADLGVLACVHPHLGTELQDREELDAVMELTDERVVYFCPDTAHLAAAGMDPAVFASRSGDEALPIFCELGLGTIDFAPIMQALADVDYDGWLTVEIDQSTSTPYQSLRQCRDSLTKNLGLSL